MRKSLLSLAIVAAGLHNVHAEEWVVEAAYPDQATLDRTGALFQHAIVDHKRHTLRVDTDEAGIDALEGAGFSVSIDVAGTAQLQGFQERMQAAIASHAPHITGAGYPSIPGYSCYRTVEGAYQTMDDLEAAHPNLVDIDPIGSSWEQTQNPANGYGMRALRITNFDTLADDPQRPVFVAFSSIHAREYTPAELMTRMAEWLVNGYGTDAQATWLVDHTDFRLILMANPDGRKKAETGLLWRKNTDTASGNCSSSPDDSGIDLNRNFPFHWNTGSGSSGNKCAETYHGPSAASEPETQNLVAYVAGTPGTDGTYTGGALPDRRTDDLVTPAPDDYSGLFFDIHSYSQLVLWSWGDTYSNAPNDTALRTLGRRIAWFNGYTPEASIELYPTDGTTDDTFYGLLGAPSYTIELGVDFFESCSTFENATYPHNLAALRYAARSTYAPYQLPAGPDTISVSGAPDLVAEGSPIHLHAQLDSSRLNTSNGSQTTYPVASAAAYIGTTPWAADAAPIAMSASDGGFDSTTEDVEADLPSTGLAAGRHLVFVQGTDSAGHAGTPDATFVEIAPAESIATLDGTITTAADGSPVVATVTATNPVTGEQRSSSSDASDGSYVRTMLDGSVDIHVAADGYLSEDLQGVTLSGGQSITRDFQLLPTCTLFTDDVENGGDAWSAQSPWTIATNVSGNTTHVWNTPNYGNNLDRSLTSVATYDLTGYADIAIDFDDRCATESGYDYGYAEFSTDGGSTWDVAYSCTGQTSWQSHHVVLPASADGSSTFKLRFRLSTDVYENDQGWAIDNIQLSAGGDACRDQQQPADDTIFRNGFEG